MAIIEIPIIAVCHTPRPILPRSLCGRPELGKAGGHVGGVFQDDAGERHQVASGGLDLGPRHQCVDGHWENYIAQQVDLQHLLVEVEDRAERLVLGRGRDVAIDGEVIEEGLDFYLPHLARMPKAVEPQEAVDPVAVGLLGSTTAMLAPQSRAHDVHQLECCHIALGSGNGER